MPHRDGLMVSDMKFNLTDEELNKPTEKQLEFITDMEEFFNDCTLFI